MVAKAWDGTHTSNLKDIAAKLMACRNPGSKYSSAATAIGESYRPGSWSGAVEAWYTKERDLYVAGASSSEHPHFTNIFGAGVNFIGCSMYTQPGKTTQFVICLYAAYAPRGWSLGNANQRAALPAPWTQSGKLQECGGSTKPSLQNNGLCQ